MDAVQNNALGGSDKTFMNLSRPGMMPLRERAAGGAGQKGDEAAELRKASREFEAVFMAEVLKGMRATVAKEELFHGGPGEDLFESMLDDEIAKRLAEKGNMGIGELLYQDLARRFGVGQETNSKSGPVDTRINKPIPLHPGEGVKGEDSGRSIPLHADLGTTAAHSDGVRQPDVDIRAQLQLLRRQANGALEATLKSKSQGMP